MEQHNIFTKWIKLYLCLHLTSIHCALVFPLVIYTMSQVTGISQYVLHWAYTNNKYFPWILCFIVLTLLIADRVTLFNNGASDLSIQQRIACAMCQTNLAHGNLTQRWCKVDFIWSSVLHVAYLDCGITREFTSIRSLKDQGYFKHKTVFGNSLETKLKHRFCYLHVQIQRWHGQNAHAHMQAHTHILFSLALKQQLLEFIKPKPLTDHSTFPRVNKNPIKVWVARNLVVVAYTFISK